MTEQPQEPSDTIGGDDKPCNYCDEYHDIDKCGTDFPDPDILYDEIHSLD